MKKTIQGKSTMQKIGEKGMQRIAVLGAVGKMGKGIALLILQQFALHFAGAEKSALRPCRLVLIDSDEKGFPSLKTYLEDQIKKYAEKNINELRLLYKDRAELIDNLDMIQTFVGEAISCVIFNTFLEECRGCELIFEAIVEDVDIKAKNFAKLNELLGPHSYYFSNTSSIPIHVLQEKSQIHERLIGFHFYNPPAVQRLVEIIAPQNTPEAFVELAKSIVTQLKKTIVFSNDFAGFIGNGHFIREIQFACKQVDKLSKSIPLVEAIVIINTITQEFLLRPMGIFQLIDYVGIDVVQRIANIMSTYLRKPFDNALINKMVTNHILGGQYGNGSQKEGFFRYEKGTLLDVYDPQNQEYRSLNEIQNKAAAWLRNKPPLGYSWSELCKDVHCQKKINDYLIQLWNDKSPSAELAKEYALHSKEIAQELVTDGVANSINDVNTVLMNGFFHIIPMDAIK